MHTKVQTRESEVKKDIFEYKIGEYPVIGLVVWVVIPVGFYLAVAKMLI